MLQLQRASAGSGKTYALAKKYIWCLITISEDNKPPRLRTHAEIIDGLPRILAITFTNKATNEMKQRIIDKLAAITTYNGEGKTPDYLDEFTKALGCSRSSLASVCSCALDVLLNDYSDFKVSTIDSFFQTVLRTFAYETDLSDTYQVELDNDYIAAAALDLLFDDIDHHRNPRGEFWLSVILKRDAEAGKVWNVFRRSTGRRATYTSLLNAIKKLDNEDFKEVRDALGKYLERNVGLPAIYTRFSDEYDSRCRSLHATVKDKAAGLNKLFADCGLDIKTEGRRYLSSQVEKIKTSKPFEAPDMKHLEWGEDDLAVKVLKKATKSRPAQLPCDVKTAETLTEAAADLYRSLSDWLGFLDSEEARLWKAYDRLFPYLGLILEVQDYISKILEAGNLLQLGETNFILSRIIGEDDTPFVYERLGTRLNHYLIDEFQDTSRLQWHNLRPLLCESESHGHYNLVIGDAKQSIYRFRNADPSLITHTVPSDFPVRVPDGDPRVENTNWRSRRTIVEFNNLIFSSLSRLLPNDESGVADLPELYSNTVQYPHHRERSGYVEINFRLTSGSRQEADEEQPEGDTKEGVRYPELVPLLTKLHSRGYRWRDMAVLVSTHSEGDDVIDCIMNHNESLEPGAEPIEFISEESLRVSSSRAVKTVVSALEVLEDSRDRKKLFNFYAMRHPELDTAAIIEKYLPSGKPAASSPIDELVAGMETVALPALVEEMIREFVPLSRRSSEAMFISAFQDMVLSFCEGHSADVTSFMDWWRSKGCNTPISSPEGTDAVQIMTIHKSKGLEFRCVILPQATTPLRKISQGNEWRWVKPSKTFDKEGELPTFVPVLADSTIADTAHDHELRVFHDLYTMDMVNKFYVAFTRAVDELYIFTSLRKPTKNSLPGTVAASYPLGDCLRKILEYPDENEAKADGQTECLLPYKLVDIEYDSDNRPISIKIGEPCEQAAKASADSVAENADEEALVLDDYNVGRVKFHIKYRTTDTLSSPEDGSGEDTSDEDGDEDADPRSEGNLLHAVMERVRAADDIPLSVLRMQVKGLFSRAKAIEVTDFLRQAVSAPEVSDWFSGKWKVLNERDILTKGERNRRPDRVMVSADGSEAIVVDYKFGAEPKGNSHRRQVEGYVSALQQAGLAPKIRGYVWYVKSCKIVAVEN